MEVDSYKCQGDPSSKRWRGEIGVIEGWHRYT